MAFTAAAGGLYSRAAECEGKALNKHFIADAAEVASPSVVNIQCLSRGRFLTGTSSGSGFILNKEGFIVTNAHVVKMASGGRVNIRFWNSARDRTGTIHSLDEESDIALIKLDTSYLEDLPISTIGCSSKLRPGEFVVALGSPLLLQGTVTAGIVSSTARHSAELGMARNLTEYIQTDTAINVGNSGGPLVNLEGEVIGINTMKANADGISFAIPIDSAMTVINQLMKHGKVSRPKLGVRIVNLHEGNNNKNSNSRKGSILGSGDGVKILVVDVEQGGPAQQAGLRKGDIITMLNGKYVSGVRELLETISMGHVQNGNGIHITVTHIDGSSETIKIHT